MKFYPAPEKRSIWRTMRQSLYNDLDTDFDESEMDAITRDSNNRESFIIYENSKPIGMLELSLRNFVDGCLSNPVAYIEGIFVEQEHRGKGYGKQLVEYAKSWGRSRGCTEIATDAELMNVDAQSFHERAGFQETFRVVNYKMDIN